MSNEPNNRATVTLSSQIRSQLKQIRIETKELELLREQNKQQLEERRQKVIHLITISCYIQVISSGSKYSYYLHYNIIYI